MNKIIDLLGLSEFKEKIISLIPTKISQLDNDSEYAKKKEINDLKKYVSDGKKLVADAITDKGVETAADAAFATMAENIDLIDTDSNVKLQESKTVSPKISDIQTVTPDEGYDGLSKVVVLNANLTSANLKSDIVNNQTYGGKSYRPSSEYIGYEMVTISPVRLQSKTITPDTSSQTVVPDSNWNGLSQVTVNAVPTQAKTVTPTTAVQTINPDSGKWLSQVTVNAISTQEKTVAPTTVAQSITPDSGKWLSKVTVNAAKLQNKSITPTSSIQTITPDSGFYGLGAVSIAAIPGLSTVEKLGNTKNLTIIPDGYTIYCFICPGRNDGNPAPFYGTVNSEGYINRFDYSYSPDSATTIYVRFSVFDSSIGGTTPITQNARMICYGFK